MMKGEYYCPDCGKRYTYRKPWFNHMRGQRRVIDIYLWMTGKIT